MAVGKRDRSTGGDVTKDLLFLLVDARQRDSELGRRLRDDPRLFERLARTI